MAYTEEYLLGHLKNLRKSLNRIPGKNDLNKTDGARAQVYSIKYGSIELALREAGIYYDDKTKRLKDDIIIDELKSLSSGGCQGATVREIYYSLKTKKIELDVHDIGVNMAKLERKGIVKKTGRPEFYIWSLK